MHRPMGLAALCFVLLGSALAHADRTERIIRKDGTVITGEVIGFREGSYVIKTGASVLEVATQDVRTILQVDDPIENPETATVRASQLSHRTVLDALPLRRHPQVASDNERVFEESVAQVIRGEWDLALRGLRELLDREPDWVEPQLLRAILASERGDHSEALGIALLLEQQSTLDAFAHRVAAEVFRMAGFMHRYAETLENVLLGEDAGGPVHRNLTELWWPIDRERAARHWSTYLSLDPQLAWPGCEEGEARRRVERALSIEDWNRAAVAFADLVRRFPWATEQARFLEVMILESRLKSAEAHGRLEEAVLCCRTLSDIAPRRSEEWRARLGGLRSFLLSRACDIQSFDALLRWCRLHAHLLGNDLDGWRGQLSVRFQQLGFSCLARGEIPAARACMIEARRWDELATPADLETAFAEVVKRLRSDLRVGRDARAFELCRVLSEAYPDRAEPWRQQVVAALEEGLGAVEEKDLAEILEQVRVAFIAAPSSASGRDTGSVPNPSPKTDADADADAAAVYAAILLRDSLARYFPHTPGTRWVYQGADGAREERTVLDVGRDESGATRVRIQIAEANGEKTEVLAFLKETDVVLHAPVAPPGEIVLRYPFTDQASWSWQKEIFSFDRVLSRPRAPLQLPTGTFTDYVVVNGENSIPGAPGSPRHSTKISVTYVAGVGMVKIEAENPALARTLVEFHPPAPGSAQD
ncbi:MAG: tetratricopeptide repeat protein [Planctomycetota bacterium]